MSKEKPGHIPFDSVDEAYEAGYRDGGSSKEDDFQRAFEELFGEDPGVIGPWELAKWVLKKIKTPTA